jgi:putative spermidine/putrescine transport system permease protein
LPPTEPGFTTELNVGHPSDGLMTTLNSRSSGLWLLTPLLVLEAFLVVLPLGRIVWRSIGGTAIDLAGYVRVFGDPIYIEIGLRTFRVAAVVTAICVLVGYPLAVLMTGLSRRALAAFSVCLLVPLFTAFLIRTYAWMIILGRNGVLNKLLLGLGLIDQPVKLLGSPVGVFVGMVHVLLPMATLTMYASFAQIDRSLTAAAATLGASPVRTFVAIYFPLSLPGMMAAGVLVFIVSLGFYITPALLGGPGDTMISQLIVTQVSGLLNLEFGAAISVVLLLAVLLTLGLAGTVLPLGAIWGEEARLRIGRQRDGVGRRRVAAAMIRLLETVLLPMACLPHVGRLLLYVHAALCILFFLSPLIVVYILSFSSSPFLIFPPPGYSLRWYARFLSDEGWRVALGFSLAVGLLTAALALLIGGMGAFGLVRSRIPGKRAVFLLALSPLLVPVIVFALALYQQLGDVGLIGTVPGVVLGHLVMATPYVVLIMTSAVRDLDPNLEHAAATLGSAPLRTLRRVTLPLLLPSLVAGGLMAFLASFDELLISLFLLGRLPLTLPIKMWNDIRFQIDPTISAASSLIVTAILLAVALVQLRRSRVRTGPALPT